jgi:hypothetical protein
MENIRLVAFALLLLFVVVATAEAATELGLVALRNNSLQSTSLISGYRKFAVIGNQQ